MKITLFIFVLVASANGFAARAETNTDNLMPPMPPSPVEEFRKWLRMPKAGRVAALAQRTPQTRETLNKKLDEYELMTKDERVRRLNAVELRWYLRPLMEKSPAERSKSLERIPVRWRPTLEERLREWDQVEPALQKEILKSESTVLYISSPGMPPPLPLAPELKVFFNLPARDQEKALHNFAPGERAEMIKTLQAFRDLPSEQRAECVRAFAQFAAMNPAEQAIFLRNVDRWQAMSQPDRDKWREIVNAIPPMPPLPPGLGQPPMPDLQ